MATLQKIMYQEPFIFYHQKNSDAHISNIAVY